MVGIINPISPTILDTYGTAAKAVKMSVAPPMMAGGVYTKGTAGVALHLERWVEVSSPRRSGDLC